MTDSSHQPRPAPPPPIDIGGRRFHWGTRTFVMGVINCTTDSFAGDGVGHDTAAAVRRAVAMAEGGADILDIGAESTRPGFKPVGAEEELARLIPAISAVRRELDIPISVDTTKGVVARAALNAGASIINDVNGLRGEEEVALCVAKTGATAVVAHNQRNRPFHDVIDDIRAGWAASFRVADSVGIPRSRLLLDPGFGFGWRPQQNLEMLRRLRELVDVGCPLLLGTSRKSTIGHVLDLPVDERLEGTAATVALAIANGADIIRVHDVAEMVRVARMTDAVVRGWSPPGDPAL